MNKVNTFHIGPQKSGTTWLYRALLEHDEVCSHSKDSIHFFDMFYCKGYDWYSAHFLDQEKKIIFDPTGSYIRDQNVPKRIYSYNPDAKIMFTARNPAERAFSHYWHEKKKGRFNFTFDEVLTNYDLFCNWVEPGFYASHINRYLKYFPKEQIKVLFFDDLNNNPASFYKDVCQFCGINADFSPSVLNKRINEASYFKPYKQRKFEQSISINPTAGLLVRVKNKLFDHKEIEKFEHVDATLKNQLIDVFYDDISKFEQITGRDLTHWKNKFE